MRYTIHKILQADYSEIASTVLEEADDMERAKRLAEEIACWYAPYGVAIVDHEVGTVDFGVDWRGSQVRDKADVAVV